MTLHMTSGQQKPSAAVKHLQKVLAGDNVWKKNFRPGKIDGVYGPGTAGAVERAKWWMGYPAKQCEGGIVGDTFFKLMSGQRKLPPAYLKTHRQRVAAAAVAAAHAKLRLTALQNAKSQNGQTEHPADSNRSKFSLWYGFVGPWCAMFVTWCYVMAGSKVFKRGSKWAYVPYILAAMYQAGSGITRTADPQPGDLVLYDWDGDGEPDHIGLFEGWISKSAGTFSAWEGNTDYGNNSNGGKVMERKDRNKSEVRAFGTVHV